MSGKGFRLLALDGGGIRGLSSLLILEQLMHAVDPFSDPPCKPHEYFDIIGGTSTGGLIAIMLGRLKMGVAECIDAYVSLSDKVFRPKTIVPVKVNGVLRARFDSKVLEQAIKDILEKQGLPEDSLLRDTADAKCKVFVCTTRKDATATACFTSYSSPRSDPRFLRTVKIWEACRATSAASTFFEPIRIGTLGEEFVDGGTGANNPVWQLWHQAQIISGHSEIDSRIECLVSIGTGATSRKPFKDSVFHIHDTLRDLATETETTAEDFLRNKSHLHDAGRYFRFNVQETLGDIGLEETKRMAEIGANTKNYLSSEAVSKQMAMCARRLSQTEG